MPNFKSQKQAEDFDGLTLRQFILNEEPINELVPSLQRGFFTIIFGALIKYLSETAKRTIFPFGVLLTFINNDQGIKRFTKKNNKNAESWFNVGLNVVLGLLETIAVILAIGGLVVSPVIAPTLFVVMIGINLLRSFYKVVKHGFICLFNWSIGEDYSAAHKAHMAQFKKAGIDFLMSSVLGLGIAAVFFLPVAFPALVVPALFVLTVKCVITGIYGLACLAGIGKHFGVWNWLQKKFNHHEKEKPAPEKKALLAAVVFPSSKLSPTIKQEYLHTGKFLNLNSTHVDDLITRMELLYEEDRNNGRCKQFLLELIQQEVRRIVKMDRKREQHIKYKALKNLQKLIEDKPLFRETSTYANSVAGLTHYYKDRGKIADILQSLFEDTGGTQKIFVLADYFLTKIPKPIILPTEKEPKKPIEPLFKADPKPQLKIIIPTPKKKDKIVTLTKSTAKLFSPSKPNSLKRSQSMPNLSFKIH